MEINRIARNNKTKKNSNITIPLYSSLVLYIGIRLIESGIMVNDKKEEIKAFNLRMKPELYNWLTEYSKDKGISMNSLINKTLVKLLISTEKEISMVTGLDSKYDYMKEKDLTLEEKKESGKK